MNLWCTQPGLRKKNTRRVSEESLFATLPSLLLDHGQSDSFEHQRTDREKENWNEEEQVNPEASREPTKTCLQVQQFQRGGVRANRANRLSG
jgi:hypothetical protein